MAEQLITSWDYELSEPPCAPGSGRYGLKITTSRDISAVFPYLNAVMEDTVYDHENKVLIGREGRRMFALREREIQVSGLDEATQAPSVAREAIALVNRVWQEHGTIQPRFSERKLPTAISIFRQLPKTNCRQCGYATCLVFAAELRLGKCSLPQCRPLFEVENADRKKAIETLFVKGQ